MSDRKEVTTQTTEEVQRSLEGEALLQGTKSQQSSEEIKKEVKSRRGRKIKYQTDEERIEARRRQQKAYRERKKKELLKLKELVEKNKKEQTLTEEQALTDSLEEELDE